MNDAIIQPSHEALATFADGQFTEFFAVAAVGEDRELVSFEFFERRPDLGEIADLKQCEWDLAIPPGARLFAASAGLLRDRLGSFWTGWQDDQGLSALSVLQESPIRLPVEPDDRFVMPPVVQPSRLLHLYFWRPSPDGWTLQRHEVSGEHGLQATAQTVKLASASSEPVLSTAAPVPGDELGRTVVVWIASTKEGLVVETLLLSDGPPVRLTARPLPGLLPLTGQRPAIHVTREGQATVALVAAGIGVVFVETVFTAEPTSGEGTVTALGIAPDALVSACAFYYQDPEKARGFLCTLDRDGTLALRRPGTDLVQVVREDVDPAYTFPIVTSYGARYEARFDERGAVKLSALP